MQKIRLSYTLIRLFEQKRYEDLVDFYFKLNQSSSTMAQEEGKAWDRFAMEYVLKNNKLPEEFDAISLNNYRLQHKIVTETDDFELVGVLDILDLTYNYGVIYELKTGSSKDSADYLNDMQVPFYLYLCSSSGIAIEKAYVIHYNQLTNQTDKSLLWFSPGLMLKVEQWINKRGNEIKEYFMSQGLI